jgi:hypothetical protein
VTSPGNSVEQAIQEQISAFQRDNIEDAFQFAAPSIQNAFGNSDQLGILVLHSSPIVHDQRHFSFQHLNEIGDTAVQDVLIEGLSRELHLQRYAVILFDGEWKFTGVEILRGAIVAI